MNDYIVLAVGLTAIFLTERIRKKPASSFIWLMLAHVVFTKIYFNWSLTLDKSFTYTIVATSQYALFAAFSYFKTKQTDWRLRLCFFAHSVWLLVSAIFSSITAVCEQAQVNDGFAALYTARQNLVPYWDIGILLIVCFLGLLHTKKVE